mmetsp:Transcript_60732/g.127283  ORF Transcript_60732/g.127283 Transcript_60732/m.127283 type:complete len:91 (-) Transcript_60732:177-449(-)
MENTIDSLMDLRPVRTIGFGKFPFSKLGLSEPHYLDRALQMQKQLRSSDWDFYPTPTLPPTELWSRNAIKCLIPILRIHIVALMVVQTII